MRDPSTVIAPPPDVIRDAIYQSTGGMFLTPAFHCAIAVGRWTWDPVAGGVGSVSPPIVPLVGVLAIGAATLLVANLLAGGPGWAAGRVPPAEILRAE